MSGYVKHILVFLDGTEESVTAAQYGICLAKSEGALLSVLFNVNTRALNDLVKSHIFIQSEQDEYQQDLKEDGMKYLKLVEKMASQKDVAIALYEESGAVLSVVNNFIKDHDVDLLLCGKISTIRSRRDELNSDTERVMRSAPCSVLIVKDEERVWDIFENLV